jgi:hypothetical protein
MKKQNKNKIKVEIKDLPAGKKAKSVKGGVSSIASKTTSSSTQADEPGVHITLPH